MTNNFVLSANEKLIELEIHLSANEMLIKLEILLSAK